MALVIRYAATGCWRNGFCITQWLNSSQQQLCNKSFRLRWPLQASSRDSQDASRQCLTDVQPANAFGQNSSLCRIHISSGKYVLNKRPFRTFPSPSSQTPGCFERGQIASSLNVLIIYHSTLKMATNHKASLHNPPLYISTHALSWKEHKKQMTVLSIGF